MTPSIQILKIVKDANLTEKRGNRNQIQPFLYNPHSQHSIQPLCLVFDPQFFYLICCVLNLTVVMYLSCPVRQANPEKYNLVWQCACYQPGQRYSCACGKELSHLERWVDKHNTPPPFITKRRSFLATIQYFHISSIYVSVPINPPWSSNKRTSKIVKQVKLRVPFRISTF